MDQFLPAPFQSSNFVRGTVRTITATFFGYCLVFGVLTRQPFGCHVTVAVLPQPPCIQPPYLPFQVEVTLHHGYGNQLRSRGPTIPSNGDSRTVCRCRERCQRQREQAEASQDKQTQGQDRLQQLQVSVVVPSTWSGCAPRCMLLLILSCVVGKGESNATRNGHPAATVSGLRRYAQDIHLRAGPPGLTKF